MINRRPSMEDFLNNYVTIPRKMATDERNIILHQDSASPGSFCYVAILPENVRKHCHLICWFLKFKNIF